MLYKKNKTNFFNDIRFLSYVDNRESYFYWNYFLNFFGNNMETAKINQKSSKQVFLNEKLPLKLNIIIFLISCRKNHFIGSPFLKIIFQCLS